MATTSKVYSAVNWNTPENDYALIFWEQNLKQFWIDTEYIPSNDIQSYKNLSPEMREAYNYVLGGLTLLDTLQSTTGMPKLIDHVDLLQNKTVLAFMSMMEGIHAKSYSTIFTTVATMDTIDEVFAWIEQNPQLQYKSSVIDSYYRALDKKNVTDLDIYMAMVASILLESFLFYSGFFLPLYLAGHGEMVASGDIIKKILQDENVHGLFVGLLAQEQYAKLTPDNKELADTKTHNLLMQLMDNEIIYTNEIYKPIGLEYEVSEFLKYNANKALQNMGRKEMYTNVEMNPIVLNGLSTETTQHDFFSKKSTNYEMSVEVTHLQDEDFNVDIDSI